MRNTTHILISGLTFFAAIFIAIFVVFGCAAIDGKRLERDIRNYTTVIEDICQHTELFELVGKQAPAPEVCEIAIMAGNVIQDNYGDALAIAEVVSCIEGSSDAAELTECVKSVKWWPILIDRINKEVEKLAD